MLRKKRQPAPFLRMPGSPFNPITGQRAPLRKPENHTRVAMFQVIEADTHDNYVVCRGFDPESGKFFNTIPVAKPYGVRGTFPYSVGQVLTCAKPLTRLGETPGVASVSTGQPADLDEAIEILTDDDDKAIAWIELGERSVSTPAPAFCYAAGGLCPLSSDFATFGFVPVVDPSLGLEAIAEGGSNKIVAFPESAIDKSYRLTTQLALSVGNPAGYTHPRICSGHSWWKWTLEEREEPTPVEAAAWELSIPSDIVTQTYPTPTWGGGAKFTNVAFIRVTAEKPVLRLQFKWAGVRLYLMDDLGGEGMSYWTAVDYHYLTAAGRIMIEQLPDSFDVTMSEPSFSWIF